MSGHQHEWQALLMPPQGDLLRNKPLVPKTDKVLWVELALHPVLSIHVSWWLRVGRSSPEVSRLQHPYCSPAGWLAILLAWDKELKGMRIFFFLQTRRAGIDRAPKTLAHIVLWTMSWTPSCSHQSFRLRQSCQVYQFPGVFAGRCFCIQMGLRMFLGLFWFGNIIDFSNWCSAIALRVEVFCQVFWELAFALW